MAQQESTLRVGVDSKPMVDGAKRGEKALDDLGRKSQSLEGTFNELTSKTNLLRGAFALLASAGVATFFSNAVKSAATFETKMAEISTLVDTTVFQINRLEDALISQSAQFGSTAVEQGAAAYQIISAGASTATDAINLLTASNKLAVGGVTDVATAADGLTSLLNAYGLSSGQAAEVSDALFVGMKAGKTTIGELSASLGKVAPLAAQAGVGVDELVAAVAALTKGGISTQEAVTGVRAIMASVVKPTKEATDIAKSLGIEFNSTALESKGLGEFMADLVEKTGGNTDAMAQLFGGVEALVPALALAGQAGVDMSSIMADMAEKSGATQEAFEKMTATFEFQASVLRANLMTVIMALGEAITNVLTPAITFINEHFQQLTIFVGALAAGFSALLIPAIVGLIPVVASATVGFLAMAAAFALTPFGLIAIAITGAAAALAYFANTSIQVGGITTTVFQAFTAAISVAWDLIKEGASIVMSVFSTATDAAGGFFDSVITWLSGFADYWKNALDVVLNFIKSYINSYIGLFVGLINAIGPVITQGIPAMFNLAMGIAQNIVISAMQGIVSTVVNALGGVGDALSYIPGVADDLGSSIRNALEVDLSGLKADTEALRGEFASAGETITSAFGDGQRDYVGAFGDVVSEVGDSLQNRLVDKLTVMNEEISTGKTVTDDLTKTVTGLSPALTDLGGAAGGAAGAVKDLNKEKEEFLKGIDDEFAKIQEGQGGAVEAVEMWYKEQSEKLAALGLEYGDYAEKLEYIFNDRMAAAYQTDLDNATDWRSGIERAVVGIGESVGDESDLAEGALTSAFDNAASAISDFAKTGTLDFKKFASSVASDILMMTTKMLLLKALKTALGGFSEGGPVVGPTLEMATGGPVFGAGGPKSDSIPAMLSNGEYVINAAQTAKYGPLLDAINRDSLDMATLAGGGFANERKSMGSIAPPTSNVDASSQNSDKEGQGRGGNITIIPQIGPADVAQSFDGDEGDVILVKMIERNATTIKGILS